MKLQLSDHFTYRKLLRFVAAPIAMMVFTSIYGVVDGLFVSNYVGKLPFTALNLLYPFYMIMGSVGFMIGTGGSALIGVALGENRREDANSYFSFLIYFTIAAGAAVAAAGELVLPYIAEGLGARGALYEPFMVYGRWMFASLPFFMLQNVFQAFFSTAEKPMLGFYVCVAAGVANILLDALLVAVFPFGIGGAAVATGISQLIGSAASILYFARENTSLLRLGRGRFERRVLVKACANGSSEFISNTSMSAVSILYNLQLMKYAGENGVAAYGVLMYVGFIFFAIFIGYTIGASPLISYHLGAGCTEELRSLFRKSMVLMGVFGVVLTALAQLLARPLALLFVGYDPALCEMTRQAFVIYAFSFLFSGFGIFGSALFTALNDGLRSAAISFSRTLLFQVGCVLVMPAFFGLDGIWFSLTVAELFALAVSFAFICAGRKKYHYM